MRKLLPFLALCSLGEAQPTNVRVIGTTATQAVIVYNSPDASACTVEVREGNSGNPLVHDVDTTLFASSSSDNRAGSINQTGNRRIFVAGKRTAELSTGKYYSRALQVATQHYYKITCTGGNVTGFFTTDTIPLGHTLNEPFPVDPNIPGTYAYPTFNWDDRTQTVIDPQTGVLIRQLDSPNDSTDVWPGASGFSFGSMGVFASASGTNWTTPSNVIVDDASTATYAAATSDWLILPFGVKQFQAGAHSAGSENPTQLNVTFNAWSTATGASGPNRTIQVCLTIDGVSCATDMLEAVLTTCTSSCTGAPQRFNIIATTPGSQLTDWFTSTNNGIATIDAYDIASHNGTVNRTTTAVTYVSGDHFNIKWASGTPITINSVAYTISSVNSENSITLSSGVGSESGVAYTANAAGVMIRKKSNTTDNVTIQYATWSVLGNLPLSFAAEGDQQDQFNCALQTVAGPGSEQGWHCSVGQVSYWIGATTGTTSRIAPSYLNNNSGGGSDGWGSQQCSVLYWDASNANQAFCVGKDNGGNYIILKLVYTGSNTDIGNIGYQPPTTYTICGSTPCWTITNLTPASTNNTITQQLAAFHPLWNTVNFHSQNLYLTGRMIAPTNALVLTARTNQNNDVGDFNVVYSLQSNTIIGMISTWGTWPLRWAGQHGMFNINDPNWIWIGSTGFRGPYSSSDGVLMNGPYYTNITSGAVSTSGTTCPAAPTPLIFPFTVTQDWPIGNNCLVVTIDGQPGDPTPAQYNTGTVTTSGTSVTLSGSTWNTDGNGNLIKINGVYYTFTYVSATTGTLNTSAGSQSGQAYILFREPINNAKTNKTDFAYLQDLQPGDLMCGSATLSGCNLSFYPAPNEVFRVLSLVGTTLTLERGYGGSQGRQSFLSLASNSILNMIPASCAFDISAPCSKAIVVWNPLLDPLGTNTSGTTLLMDAAFPGCCHSEHQTNISADQGYTCPTIDGNGSCYLTRTGPYKGIIVSSGLPVSINPSFANLNGVGSPNAIDSHPSYFGYNTTDTSFWDVRPFFGSNSGSMTGNSGSPGTLVGGSLWKFTTAQVAKNRTKYFNQLKSCGHQPLLDISGPASTILQTSGDNYKSCTVNAVNECVSGSAVGDLYVNCPKISTPYCTLASSGYQDPEIRDICVADIGAYSTTLNQIGGSKPDITGRFGRRITNRFAEYRWVYAFDNTQGTPDGKWAIFPATWLQGQRSATLLAKIPPKPGPDGVNRGNFIPYEIQIPRYPNVDNAIVKFGYDTSYRCTSRNEACVMATTSPYNFNSETITGVTCNNGCTIQVPAISQRVLYYQVIVRSGSSAVVTMQPEAVPIP